jgi:hypothetical protein
VAANDSKPIRGQRHQKEEIYNKITKNICSGYEANISVQYLALLLRIRLVHCSNFGSWPSCYDWRFFVFFSQSSQQILG